MIKEYKHIAIIWGGKTQQYAKKLAKKINDLHIEKRMPMVADMVNNPIVSNILIKDIEKLFDRASHCIVFISLDDLGARESDYIKQKEGCLARRIRQNVVLELGMAVGRFGDDKYTILSDFVREKENCELPSDLQTITPTYFTEENFDAVCNAVIDKLTSKLDINPYLDLLSKEYSVLDFENLFQDTQDSFYKLADDRQIISLFDEWWRLVDSFDFYSEKILFILERIKFFPCFSRGDSQVKKIYEIASLLEMSNYYEQEEKVSLEWAIELTCAALRYTAHRLDVNTQYEEKGYLECYNKFKELIKHYESTKDKVQYSPLLVCYLYEFFGLAKMHGMAKSNALEAREVYDSLVRAKDSLSRFRGSVKIIQGFLLFDLARAAATCFRNNKDDNEVKETMIESFTSCIEIRKSWLRILSYPNYFKNAVSFEYFKAVRYSLNCYLSFNIIGGEEALKQARELLSGIDNYNLVNLERLSIERKALVNYMKELKPGSDFYD